MLTHPTTDRLEALGFTGMAKALDERRTNGARPAQRRANGARPAQRRASDTFESLSFEERLGLLVDRETTKRSAQKLATRLRFASLRQAACVEE